MDLLQWMGKMYARFVALAIALLGLQLVASNITSIRFEWWIWAMILIAGIAGIVGGGLFLLSLDGPERFRTKKWRILGWSLMLAAAALPTSLTLMTVPLVLLLIPGLFKGPWNQLEDGAEVTSS